MTQLALNLENVSLAFGATQALSNVDFQIAKGEVRALIGANGAGKSTLIKVMTGVHQPDSGVLTRNGHAYRPGSPEGARKEGIHAVFQELSIFPHLTVLENIFAGALVSNGLILDQSKMRSLALDALKKLGHDISLDALAGDLPVSEQQIVEIARATVHGADVLLLDEPTSSLDITDRDRLFALIKTLKEQGTAVIYISHFLSEVMTIADTYTVLRDGKVAKAGEISSTSIPELSEAMFGRSFDSLNFSRSKGNTQEAAALLSVRELSCAGVRSATFDVHAGEIAVIFGLVDCGASELLQAIFGLRQSTGGTASLPSIACSDLLKARWRKKGIGMVAEERRSSVAGMRTIAENMMVPSWSTAIGSLVFPRRLLEFAQGLIARFGVKCRGGDQPIGELSGGNQQKVCFGRFAATDVDVLLLSEPTRGVDIAARLDLWRYIDELALSGKAIVLATTDVEEALAIADSVIVMRRGELLEKLPAASVDPERLTIAATGGSHD
jgi:ABC-type sugar transport system ATPase subunit